MKIKFKKILPWVIGVFILFSIAAVSKQLIGPTLATTPHAVVRWQNNNSFSTTNSLVIIDDSGNVTGVNIQTMAEADVNLVTVTNGFIYLQKSGSPLASTIGGTVGSLTNHMVINVGGILNDYWSDGTTVWGPKQIAP